MRGIEQRVHRPQEPLPSLNLGKLRGGDQDAWTELVGSFTPVFFRKGVERGVPREDILDAAQETFEKFYRKIDTIDENNNPAGYLVSSFGNACSDIYRRRRVRSGPSIEEAGVAEWKVEEAPSTAETVAQRDEIERVWRDLAPRDREVIRLKADGRSSTEAAEELGVPLSLVKSRLHFIRKKLREEAEQEKL